MLLLQRVQTRSFELLLPRAGGLLGLGALRDRGEPHLFGVELGIRELLLQRRYPLAQRVGRRLASGILAL